MAARDHHHPSSLLPYRPTTVLRPLLLDASKHIHYLLKAAKVIKGTVARGDVVKVRRGGVTLTVEERKGSFYGTRKALRTVFLKVVFDAPRAECVDVSCLALEDEGQL
ncbi:hypothetical protein E2C01_083488 [Portunus trituberculatus]|uniref:Uncharacterized protein n=1 Tax=Portunus trituberculatus TaxID=210409 RepID=A0A5B7J1D2_PORTR|nr:hypothetical protein [Portunus trituberculatus]